ncbi:DUF6538 domain-containing protein [Polaromonas sp.]|uniref:DUF6538 domain-containing protein n=1 Tax=Polaromonas sp. TaxID=1869339 RepID=UPI0013B72D2E|nr:DUF6538 domain-containing protein [Polaromonas sp.]NDP62937.1 tyrosine-type recombinase/integrase [Polaromonas sp.]
MKAISENLYERGINGIKYCRRRIPAALLAAYPPKKTHIVRSLGTSDLRVAKQRLKVEINRIDAEFAQKLAALQQKQASYSRKKLDSLSNEQLNALADHWVRQVLLNDERQRSEGLDDDEFDELGARLEEQRAQLGRMLATGRSDKILPAMHGFIHLCGLDVEMSPEESKRAGAAFLSAVVTSLDHQRARQGGQVVKTNDVAPEVLTPKEVATNEDGKSSKQGPDWDAVFIAWRDYVSNRPKSTAIATQTPWRELQRFATENGVDQPGELTPELMRKFVDVMAARGLAVITLNERLAKIKSLFKVVKGRGVLSINPAADTLGLKQNSFEKREKRRLPFDNADLGNIFSSPIFNHQQLRSQGQAGEATYWIPILMYYTGARTEEIAGLALADVVQDPEHGWYFNIIDRPSQDDDLFSEEQKAEKKKSNIDGKAQLQWRLLKNGTSIRKVPLATELINLGLFRYMDSVREKGEVSLFPSLSHDWHDKLSGAFSKFFGRYKTKILGIHEPKKVLYSFRHTMKDAMTNARVETKYLQRILGHASGEGSITDGYGSADVPLDALMDEFRKVKFFPIDAHSWQPGKGRVKFPKLPKTTGTGKST